MRHPVAKDSAQVTLVDGNHVVQAFSSYRSNQPLAVGVGFWRLHRSAQNLQPKSLQVFINFRGEDRVTIMDEKAISMITGNSFAKLLQGPISRGMLRHIEVNDATRSDVDQQQYIENTKAGGDGDHEITGDDRLGMIVNETLPGLRPWPWLTGWNLARPVGSYRTGRNFDAELQGQLVGDACLSPGWILPNHLGNQKTKADGNAGPPWSRLPLPKELEPLAVPADQGFWFDDDQSIPPIAEPGPKQQAETSRGGQSAGPNPMFLIKGQLLAKKEVFGSKYGATSAQGLQKANTVGDAINKDREEGGKELEEARELAH